MTKVTLADAKKAAKELKIKGIPISTIRKGMQVELEHGPISAKTDVTHGNLKATAKIALAHLKEGPDYYEKLAKMEKTFKKESHEGNKKKKPKIKKSSR